MRKYTTDEIEKALLVCAEGRSCNGCIEISKSCEMGCIDCIISLKRVSANRLKSQQKEIYELKKQIAETYTAEQFSKDVARYLDSKHIDYPEAVLTPKLIEEWAKYHPEKPKVTNGDKVREVFGEIRIGYKCFRKDGTGCLHHDDDVDCYECEYGPNAEYKEPSDK